MTDKEFSFSKYIQVEREILGYSFTNESVFDDQIICLSNDNISPIYPKRVLNGKYAVTPDQYPMGHMYPQFCFGPGTAMSISASKKDCLHLVTFPTGIVHTHLMQATGSVFAVWVF